jgi:uncharacterized protein YkwD/LysM repeat protein
MSLVLVSFISLASTVTTQAGANRTPVYADSPYDLINAVNALRDSLGLAPYGINPILMAAAQGHADYMAATGSASHTGAGGSSVTERLLALGYPLAGELSLGGFRSENITSGNEGMSAQEAVNRWAGDAPHLNTMISPNLTEIGAGVTINGGRVYFVIDCARPTDSGIPQGSGTSVAGGSTAAPGVGGVIIPVVVVTPNSDGDVIHEVKAGQSLWQIAISYETKIDEIKRLNNLFDNEIYPGTRLLVKKGVFLTATVPAITSTLAATSSSALLATFTATSVFTRVTFTPTGAPVAASSGNTLTIAMGIIVLAVLGGGLVAWWGSVKK